MNKAVTVELSPGNGPVIVKKDKSSQVKKRPANDCSGFHFP